MTVKDVLHSRRGQTVKDIIGEKGSKSPKMHYLMIVDGPDWDEVTRFFGSSSPKEISKMLIELSKRVNAEELKIERR